MNSQPIDSATTAERHYAQRSATPVQPWSLEDPTHPTNADALVHCVTEIAMSFRAMTELASNSEPTARERLWDTALSAIRQMSVSIRKLCLDRQGASLRRAVDDPTMHPLGGAKGQWREVTLTWKSPPIEGQLSFEDGRQEQLTIPEREFQIQIGRLYGIVFLGDDACAIHSPFDYSAPPIALDAWLNLKVLQVNSVAYKISDVLRLLANAEGAHSPNLLPALIGGGFNPEQVGNGAEMKHRLANTVRFGLFSYPHLFVLFTGLHLIDRVQELLKLHGQHPSSDPIPPVVRALQRQVADLQTGFFARLPIQRNVHEMIVYDESGPVVGPGSRRVPYRIWSGSDDWDAPISPERSFD